MVVRGFLSFLLDMLAPPICVHCGSELPELPTLDGVSVPSVRPAAILSRADGGTPLLCTDCVLRLEWSGDTRLPGAASVEQDGPVLITPFFTNDVLLSLVRFLKFEGGVPAAGPLSRCMALALRRHLPRAPVLVMPVPLHDRRRRRRGYNQAALLAERVAVLLGLSYDDRILIRRRHTRSQARLGDDARDRNVRNAFGLVGEERLRGRQVLLVDDLVTSGGTLRSCVETLLRADPSGVTAVAVGRRKALSYSQICVSSPASSGARRGSPGAEGRGTSGSGSA